MSYEDDKRIKIYFNRNGKTLLKLCGGFLAMLCCALFFAQGLKTAGFTFWGSLFFVVIGSVGGLFWLMVIADFAKDCFHKPTDSEIDAQALSLYSQLHCNALSKPGGFDDEEIGIANPVVLWGYLLGESKHLEGTASGVYLFCEIEGKDGVWRSPEIVLSAFFFREDTILYYSRVESLVSRSFRESTDEIFYRDIVNVKIESEESPVFDRQTGKQIPGRTAHFESLVLRDTGGGIVRCPVRDSAEAEQAVNNMRNLFRRKKSQ